MHLCTCTWLSGNMNQSDLSTYPYSPCNAYYMSVASVLFTLQLMVCKIKAFGTRLYVIKLQWATCPSETMTTGSHTSDIRYRFYTIILPPFAFQQSCPRRFLYHRKKGKRCSYQVYEAEKSTHMKFRFVYELLYDVLLPSGDSEVS